MCILPQLKSFLKYRKPDVGNMPSGGLDGGGGGVGSKQPSKMKHRELQVTSPRHMFWTKTTDVQLGCLSHGQL